jgi:drug/metabolite transporter (DMT)-like permease
MPARSPATALTGFVVLCLVWGTSWVAIKYSLEAFPPLLGATLRFSLAGLFLFAYCRLRSIPVSFRGQPWRVFLITAFLVYVVNYGLIYWAEQYLKAGVAAVVFATFPLFTGILSNFVFQNEPFRMTVYVGIALGFFGVLLIFYDDFQTTELGAMVAWSTLAVLGSSISAAASSLIVKKHLGGIHPVQLTLHQLILGTAGLLVAGVCFGELSHVGFSMNGLLAVIYLGLVASAFAFALYYWLLQEWSAVSVSLLVYFTPMVAIVLGWVMLGESLSSRTLAGVGIILGGVLIAQVHKYRSLFTRSA